MRGDWGIQASVSTCLVNSQTCVDVIAGQATHFICATDCQVLENDFAVFSAYDSRHSTGFSLLVGRSLDADVNVVFAGDGGRLIVADVAVKSIKIRVVAVVPYIAAEGTSFFDGWHHSPTIRNR